MITTMKRMPLGRFSWVVLVDVALAVTIGSTPNRRKLVGNQPKPCEAAQAAQRLRSMSRERATSTNASPSETESEPRSSTISRAKDRPDRPIKRRNSIPQVKEDDGSESPGPGSLITRQGSIRPDQIPNLDAHGKSHPSRIRRVRGGRARSASYNHMVLPMTRRKRAANPQPIWEAEQVARQNWYAKIDLIFGPQQRMQRNRKRKIEHADFRATFDEFSKKLKELVDFEKVKADPKLSQHAFQKWDDFIRYLMKSEDVLPANPMVSPVKNWLKNPEQSPKSHEMSACAFDEAANGVPTYQHEPITTQSVYPKSRELVELLREAYSEYMQSNAPRSLSRSSPPTSSGGKDFPDGLSSTATSDSANASLSELSS